MNKFVIEFDQRMRKMMAERGISSRRLIRRTDTEKMLTALLTDKPTSFTRAVDSLASLLSEPLGSDEMIKCLSVLGEGSYGKTSLCRLRVDESKLNDREIVVKSGIQDGDMYRNMLYEIFVNQFIIKPEVLTPHYSIPNFPVMYSFLICKASGDQATLCDAPIDLRQKKPRTLDRQLREGKLQIFPIFERVQGDTLRDYIKSRTKSLRFDELSRICKQVWLALDALNGAPSFYSHNDLHSSNIMITDTSSTYYDYLGSDARIRRVNTGGKRVQIIDQGMACASNGEVVVIFGNRPYCPPLDMFRLLGSLYRKCVKHKELSRRMTQIGTWLFGGEVIPFWTQSPDSDLFDYAHALEESGKVDRWNRIASFTYLDAYDAFQVIESFENM